MAALLAGCNADRLGPALADDVERPERSVVIFFPDGMDRTRFQQLLDSGELPHIQRRFVEGGVTVHRAFDALPSVTYANCSTMITGLLPSHHEIAGNLWLDRRSLTTGYYMTFDRYLMVNDHLDHPTLYSLLADQFTLNIQNHTHRGATCSLQGKTIFVLNWIIANYGGVDITIPTRFREAFDLANRVKRWPSVIMTYFPGVDEIGHRSGPDSPEYARALRKVDEIIGQVEGMVEQAGLADRTSYVLVSDHGMPPVGTGQQFPLARWLRPHRGLRFRNAPVDHSSYADRHAVMDQYDSFLVIGADRSALLHLRGPQGWHHRPTVEQVEAFIEADPPLHELPAVDCVLHRIDENTVKVRSRRGTALIERHPEPVHTTGTPDAQCVNAKQSRDRQEAVPPDFGELSSSLPSALRLSLMLRLEESLRAEGSRAVAAAPRGGREHESQSQEYATSHDSQTPGATPPLPAATACPPRRGDDRHGTQRSLYRMTVLEGDPLGYLDSPELADFIRAGWQPSRQWLCRTADTNHPDFVPQAAALFDSPRTGDVIIFAAAGWDFGAVPQRGAHGSCLHRDMHIPLFFAGPDLPPGTSIPCARLTDLTPTILGLLNEAHRLDHFPPLDGLDLADDLRQAGAAINPTPRP